jgi:hypothetical protein
VSRGGCAVVRKEYQYSLGAIAWNDAVTGQPIPVEGPVRPAGDGWEILLAVPKVASESGEWKLLWVCEREVEAEEVCFGRASADHGGLSQVAACEGYLAVPPGAPIRRDR